MLNQIKGNKHGKLESRLLHTPFNNQKHIINCVTLKGYIKSNFNEKFMIQVTAKNNK